jgi:hypothetical protein
MINFVIIATCFLTFIYNGSRLLSHKVDPLLIYNSSCLLSYKVDLSYLPIIAAICSPIRWISLTYL